MEPLSVLDIVEACSGLAVTAGRLAIGLKTLADNYSLECADDGIHALENELVRTSKGTVNTFWEKANVVWNLDGLKELQDCIHKQITSLGVILQILNLPTRQSQEVGLAKQSLVFQESKSSIMSIRDADTSTLNCDSSGGSTTRAESTITSLLAQIPQFDFEEILLTSRVYHRNRIRTLALHETATKVKEQQGRLKELELQLQNRVQAHQDDKSELERRIKEAEGEYREKLGQLENEYQSAVRYVMGTNVVFKKMKEELTKHKGRIKELESELEMYRSLPGSGLQATDNARLRIH